MGQLIEVTDFDCRNFISTWLQRDLKAVVCETFEVANIVAQEGHLVIDLCHLSPADIERKTPQAVKKFSGTTLLQHIISKVLLNSMSFSLCIQHLLISCLLFRISQLNDKRFNKLLNKALEGVYVFPTLKSALKYRNSGSVYAHIFTR